MRYIIFVVVLIGALSLSSGALSFKGQGKNGGVATALGGVEALSQSLEGLKETSSGPTLEHYDKAFDIREGGTVSFEELEINFVRLEISEDCEGSSCYAAVLGFAGDELREELSLSEGESVQWGGYSVKISQVAPKENKGGVPYRAVLLISKITR